VEPVRPQAVVQLLDIIHIRLEIEKWPRFADFWSY